MIRLFLRMDKFTGYRDNQNIIIFLLFLFFWFFRSYPKIHKKRRNYIGKYPVKGITGRMTRTVHKKKNMNNKCKENERDDPSLSWFWDIYPCYFFEPNIFHTTVLIDKFFLLFIFFLLISQVVSPTCSGNFFPLGVLLARSLAISGLFSNIRLRWAFETKGMR